jgi:HAD superfamily hydrolase (TIGR01509 family)
MKDISIQWLFFDVGGVLLDDSKPESLRQELLLELGQKYLGHVTDVDIQRSWLEASRIPGSVRINALRVLFANYHQVVAVEEEYKRLCTYDYHTLSQVRPEARDVLLTLSERYQLGLMANQNVLTTKLLEQAGLLSFLSHQKMSDHIGLEKPDPRFYSTILEDCKARPEESVIIDDNWYRGLLPAEQLGMKTVLYQRSFIPYPNDIQPTWVVSSLQELLEIF